MPAERINVNFDLKVKYKAEIKQEQPSDEFGPLSPEKVRTLFGIFKDKLKKGLERKGPHEREDGTTVDDGFPAIRTGIPLIPTEAWNRVRAGAKGIVVNAGGTNWETFVGKKEQDGSIILEESSKQVHNSKSAREVPFAKFIDYMVQPIKKAVKEQGMQDQPVDIGVALGFPHKNIPSVDAKGEVNGLDAVLTKVKDGVMTKGWKITDWNAEEQSNITKALRTKLEKEGIKVGTLVAINDTPAVALDGEGLKEASQKRIVKKMGSVMGSGTNSAVVEKGSIDGGMVNLEIGNETDGLGSSEVFTYMKEQGWVDRDEEIIEMATGGVYLPKVLAAEMRLLGEKGKLAVDEKLIEKLTEESDDKDQALVNKIALGEASKDEKTIKLAQDLLYRCAQTNGAILAAIAEVAGDHPGESTAAEKAILAEGGLIHKGRINQDQTLKEVAETTAAELGQKIKIEPANGKKGVLSLAMAHKYL